MEYFNVKGRTELPFAIFIGGRGIGKTYSALLECTEKKFLYIRRTAKEIEACASEYANPFKKINKNEGLDIKSNFISKIGMGYFTKNDEIIGYSGALSTFAGSSRSMDFSDVELIVFDEFIPERHRMKIKDEGEAFLNLYETVNRNREFEGKPPVKVYLLANAISLDNDILMTMGAIKPLENMINGHTSRFSNRQRGIYIEMVKDSPVSEAKRNTALYRLTSGSDFERHALSNEFVNDELNVVKKVNIIEYTPYIQFGDYTIYKHKSREDIYIAKKIETCKTVLSRDDWRKLQMLFGRTFQLLTDAVKICYDDYDSKIYFDNLMSKT